VLVLPPSGRTWRCAGVGVAGGGVKRREFLRSGSVGVALAPLIGARALVEVAKQKPEPLPPVDPYGLLTAEAWNKLVNAVNELRAAS